IVISDPPPVSDNNLRSYLAAHADGLHAGWPAATIDTNFAVFLAAGQSISTQFGTSCQAFGGYHDATTSNSGGPLVYSLLPRCDATLNTLTVATSHELVEAAPDPPPGTQPAYQSTDDDHAIWSFVPGGELGDMCEDLES